MILISKKGIDANLNNDDNLNDQQKKKGPSQAELDQFSDLDYVAYMYPQFNMVATQSVGSFGELALMENNPRAATIICSEDTHFVTLDKQNFQKFMKDNIQKISREQIEFLSKQPLFFNF